MQICRASSIAVVTASCAEIVRRIDSNLGRKDVSYIRSPDEFVPGSRESLTDLPDVSLAVLDGGPVEFEGAMASTSGRLQLALHGKNAGNRVKVSCLK